MVEWTRLAGPIAVLSLGFVGWLYRSLSEANQEPFILNMTLFAGIGTILSVVTYTSRGEDVGLPIVGAIIAALLFLALQLWIFSSQREIATEHIRGVLNKCLRSGASEAEVSKWTGVASAMVKVDFFPEFYKSLTSSSGPRGREREQLMNFLPDDVFDKASI